MKKIHLFLHFFQNLSVYCALFIISGPDFSCLRCFFLCILFSLQASKLEKQSSMPESDYDNTVNESEMEDSG